MGEKKRILYYDVLNVAACFSVIVLHFNGVAHIYSPTAMWYQALSAECLFFWAVPVFLMLTGATLMRYRDRYDTRTFFKKRLTRVLVPFLIWSVVALTWKIATGQLSPHFGPRTIIDLIFNTQTLEAYWFFIPLIAIYLAMPVLSLLAKDENDRALWYGVGVAFVTMSLLPPLFRLVGMTYNTSLNFPLFGGYLIFPVLGYLLAKTQLSKRQRLAIYAAGIVAVAIRYIAIILLSAEQGVITEQFWSYLEFPGVLPAMAVFVFAKQVRWDRLFRTPTAQHALSRVARCSLGIYLIHMFVFWHGLQIPGFSWTELAWRTVGPVVAYALCLAVVFLVKKVPGLRVVFP